MAALLFTLPWVEENLNYYASYLRFLVLLDWHVAGRQLPRRKLPNSTRYVASNRRPSCHLEEFGDLVDESRG